MTEIEKIVEREKNDRKREKWKKERKIAKRENNCRNREKLQKGQIDADKRR